MSKHPYRYNKYFPIFVYIYRLHVSAVKFCLIAMIQWSICSLRYITLTVCSCKITQTNDLKPIHICLFCPFLHISGEGHSDNNSTQRTVTGVTQVANLYSFNIPEITKCKRWKSLCHRNRNSNINKQHLFLAHRIFWNGSCDFSLNQRLVMC